MELKLVQELTIVYHNPLLLLFLDLRKAYDTIVSERLILTLEGYGARPSLCVLLEAFWAHQQVVRRHNGFLGPALIFTRGKTQGGLVSLKLFNVVVYNIIKPWLAMPVED